MFLHRGWNLSGLKTLTKKLTTQVLLIDVWVVVHLTLSAELLLLTKLFI